MGATDVPVPPRSDAAVCPFCAANLRTRSCRACRRALEPEWRVCPICGTPCAEDPGAVGLPRVLVVEDDDHVRAALQAMLAGDFAVVAAADGAEALRMVGNDRFDAVVLDKGLPDMDGYQFTREIRSRFAPQDLPVLVITGEDDPEVETEGLRAGADDWLAKPVDLEVFVARLQRLVARRRR